MKTRVEEVVSSLEIGYDDVRMIGIKGMGGGGKTTLARAVFDNISAQFEGQSFVENVRAEASKCGLKSLQKQVLSDVLNDQGITVNGVFDGKNMMKRRMISRRVLVVLDDVDHIDQLEALAGEPNWFKSGSRIIITTRDEQVLVAHRVNFDVFKSGSRILDVNLLSHEEAICLFSRYAFGREIPNEGYKDFSTQVVHYAAGLPLTMKVLGSFLCGKDNRGWKDALERLKIIPLKETLDKLEISYKGLEAEYKEIFLDVACLLKGWYKDDAVAALESQGFCAINGLTVLEQKSLITISKENRLDMHDHIEEMGKNIVRRLHPHEPWRHNRLWDEAEIKDILANEKGTKATRGIQLRTWDFDPETYMRGLRKMKNLRFLDVRRYDFEPEAYMRGLQKMKKLGYLEVSRPDIYHDDEECDRSSWKFDKCGQYLPNSLRYLRWDGLPRGSNIVQLWEKGERKALNKLRFLDLSFSKLTTFDFELSSLETLHLAHCYNMVEFHNPNGFPKLKFLHLNNINLKNFNLGPTPDLEELSLYGCDLVELHMPDEYPNLKYLNLNDNLTLRKLTLGLTPDLEELSLDGCFDLVEPHMPHSNIVRLWEKGERKALNKLRFLDLSFSKLMTFDFEITPNLERLHLRHCYDMVEFHNTNGFPKLKFLDLGYNRNLRNLTLGPTPDLERLRLEGCDLVELHMPDECPNLKYLNLNNNSTLRNLTLGSTPDLESLSLDGCCDLEELHMPYKYSKLKSIILGSSKLKTLELGLISDLETSSLEGCEIDSLSRVYLVQESIDRCPFHIDNNSSKFQVTRIYKEHPFPMYGNVEKVMCISLCACNLGSFTVSVCHLRFIKKLTLEGNIPEAPKDLYQLECLEELVFSTKKIKNLPDSLCMLKQLKSLRLKSCWLLEKLPGDIGLLECLEELIITDCILLRGIPNSICDMKRLENFHLPYCMLVEKLPEELGRLETLKELNIEGTGINYLPDSIHRLKGLLVVKTKWRLQSYGFTSVTQTSEYVSVCEI